MAQINFLHLEGKKLYVDSFSWSPQEKPLIIDPGQIEGRERSETKWSFVLFDEHFLTNNSDPSGGLSSLAMPPRLRKMR